MSEDAIPDDLVIWGPTADTFRFAQLAGGDPREEGGGLAWVERALTTYYFIQHDNEPATWAEISAWCDELTPASVKLAVEFGITVGLP